MGRILRWLTASGLSGKELALTQYRMTCRFQNFETCNGENVQNIQSMATNLFSMFRWLEDPHDKMPIFFLQQKKITTLSCGALITQKMANSESIIGAFYLNGPHKKLILRLLFNVEMSWLPKLRYSNSPKECKHISIHDLISNSLETRNTFWWVCSTLYSCRLIWLRNFDDSHTFLVKNQHGDYLFFYNHNAPLVS